MRADDLPRHYHFFLGDRFARVPEKVMLMNRSFHPSLRAMDVAEALDLMRRKAGMYVNPFDIEIYKGRDIDGRQHVEWTEVKLANRPFALRGSTPYMYHVPRREPAGREVMFNTWQEMFQHFEDRLARYVIGEATAWIS